MKLHLAQRCSSIEAAFRQAADGSVLFWASGDIPIRWRVDGCLVHDCYSIFYAHHELDWLPLAPTSAGKRQLQELEHIAPDKLDLLAHIVVSVGDQDYIDLDHLARKVLLGQ